MLCRILTCCIPYAIQYVAVQFVEPVYHKLYFIGSQSCLCKLRSLSLVSQKDMDAIEGFNGAHRRILCPSVVWLLSVTSTVAHVVSWLHYLKPCRPDRSVCGPKGLQNLVRGDISLRTRNTQICSIAWVQPRYSDSPLMRLIGP